jgi:hypothetical protein
MNKWNAPFKLLDGYEYDKGLVTDLQYGIIGSLKSQFPFPYRFLIASFFSIVCYLDIYTDINAVWALYQSGNVNAGIITGIVIALPWIIGLLEGSDTVYDKILKFFWLIYLKKPAMVYSKVKKLYEALDIRLTEFLFLFSKRDIVNAKEFKDHLTIEELFNNDPSLVKIFPDLLYGRIHYLEMMFESVPQFIIQSYLLVDSILNKSLGHEVEYSLRVSIIMSGINISFTVSKYLGKDLHLLIRRIPKILRERISLISKIGTLSWILISSSSLIIIVSSELVMRSLAMICYILFINDRNSVLITFAVCYFLRVTISIITELFYKQKFGSTLQQSLLIRSLTSFFINSSWNYDKNVYRRISLSTLFIFESLIAYFAWTLTPSRDSFWKSTITAIFISVFLVYITWLIFQLVRSWNESFHQHKNQEISASLIPIKPRSSISSASSSKNNNNVESIQIPMDAIIFQASSSSSPPSS